MSAPRPLPVVRRARVRLLAVAAALVLAAPVHGQPPGGSPAPAALQPARAELQAQLASTERRAAAAETPAEERARLQGEAELLRSRLQEGDFHPGDQVEVQVEGEAELTGTFPVKEGRVLVLPAVGELPLRGVLRAEVEEHVRAHLSRFLRDPVVRARSLVRLTVSGQVGAPGFYTLSSDALVSDALMAAGGPLPTAKLQATRIERGDQRIWQGDALRDALAAGMTLDQMGLRAGDQVIVPADGGGRGSTLLRAATVIPAAVLAVAGLIQLL